MLDSVWQDIKYAVRDLRRSPGFTITVVLTLALASGANAAIFSIFNQALVRRLPVPAPEQLVNLTSPGLKTGRRSTSGTARVADVFSYPLFRDLEREQNVFTGIAADRDFAANVAFHGQASSESGQLVSGDYFGVLGLRPALGRLLTPDDDGVRNGNHVVVLSHDYWVAKFNADVSVLNDVLVVNGQTMSIVGVTPRAYRGTTLEDRPQIFVPLSMAALMMPGLRDTHSGEGPWNGFEDRRDHWLYLFARLKEGVSPDSAERSMNVSFSAIIRDVELPLQSGLSEAAREQFRNRRLVLEQGEQGQRGSARDELNPMFVLLFCVTGLVLLIACANIANLLLARAASRTADTAVRVSLGASRLQVARRVLVESCLLAAIGGGGGLLVGDWALNAIASLVPPQASTMLRFDLDSRMMAFAAALSATMTLLFGLYPALHCTRTGLAAALKGGNATSGTRANVRLRTSLASAQIGLSVALLVVAGLFTKSLLNMSRVDLGLQADALTTFRLSPELSGYTPARSRLLFDRVVAELSASPGVTSVTTSTVPLLAGVASGTNVTVEGFDASPEGDSTALFSRIGTDYFRTLGIPMIAGREFSTADRVGAPKVAIVNEAFARKFNLGRNPVGKRMYRGAGRPLDTEIIGFVRDAKYNQLKEPPPPQFFVPHLQAEGTGALNFYLRATAPPAAMIKTIPTVIAHADATLPVENLQPMTEQARATIGLDRVITLLSSGFAILAALLAAVGLYGVLSFIVAQRTREIGLRMALGADRNRIRRLVFGHVGRMSLIGGAAGCVAALGLGRLAQAMLFGLTGQDPLVICCAAAAIAVVILCAGALPARRAARVDPITALRAE